MMRPSVPDVHITDSQDAELAEYRSLPGQAVAGLIFGLLSPLALIDPTLWVIPGLGVIFSGWALRRIRQSGEALAGRKMAMLGLILSLLMAAAAPGDWLVYRRLVADEGRQFSALWFGYITQEEPQKAYQLTVPPATRQPLDQNLWIFYRNNLKERERFEAYVESSPIRTLLALGPRAQVRFYDTGAQSRSGQTDYVELWYAVTYEEESEKKSFFVLVAMSREKMKNGEAGWRIARTQGGGYPSGW